MFLVHAVMGLAGHHVNSTSTQTHRHAALQLLRESLERSSDAGHGYSIIDAIMILFSLDVGLLDLPCIESRLTVNPRKLNLPLDIGTHTLWGRTALLKLAVVSTDGSRPAGHRCR